MNPNRAIEELKIIRLREDEKIKVIAAEYPAAAKRWQERSDALSLAIAALEREELDARNREAASSFGSDP